MFDIKEQVVLIQPFVEDFYLTDCRSFPLGLAYLSAAIKSTFSDLDVEIFDTLVPFKKRTINWPKEFNYLKPYYGHLDTAPYSLFYQYYRYGLKDKEILDKLRSFQPFLIGISSLFTPYYRESLKVAALCKSVFPDIPIVMGGSYATLYPEFLLEYKNKEGKHLTDFVLRGEAEESITQLIHYLRGERELQQVHNLVCRDNLNSYNTDIMMPVRENIEIPDYSGIDLDSYRYNKKRIAFLITSRGCPFRCSFCSVHTVFGKDYFVREDSDIINEIKIRYAEGVRHFDIEDDNFTYDRKHAISLLTSIIKLNIPITLSAMNGMCYFSLDKEILSKVKKTGFDTINLAIATLDEDTCKNNQRPQFLNKFKEVVDIATSLDLNVIASFILGMPGQTLKEIMDTVFFLSKTKCLIQVSPFYFLKGTPIYEREKDNKEIKLASRGFDSNFSARLTALDLENSQFKRDDIFTCFRLVRVINYLKKCLDSGSYENDEYYQEALQILKEKNWFAKSKKGSFELPFSKSVEKYLSEKELNITGYKTDNELRVSVDNKFNNF